MIGDALTLAAVNLAYLAAGLGILRALGLWSAPRDALRRLGLGYLTGLAAAGTLATLLLVAGASLDRLEFLVLCGALAALGLLPRRLPVRLPRRRPAARPLAALTVAFLGLLAVDLYHQPLWEADAWDQWTPKAQAIVQLGGLDPTFFQGVRNGSYPILVPALEAVDFRFMGFSTVVLHLQFWFVFAGFVLALVELLGERVRPAILWPVVFTIALAPTLAIQSAYGIADVPLGVFVALAGVCAWSWVFDGDRASLGLLTIFAAAALATKTEGELYVGTLFLVVALLLRRERQRLLWTIGAAAVSLVGIVPWALWSRTYDLRDDFSGSQNGLPLVDGRVGRIPLSALRLLAEILDPTSWLFLGPLALGAAILAWRARGRAETVLALAPPALAFAGLVWIYWNTPLEFQSHLDQSARRVIVSLVLYLAALTPLLIERALRRPDE